MIRDGFFQVPERASAYKEQLQKRVQKVTEQVNQRNYKPNVIIFTSPWA